MLQRAKQTQCSKFKNHNFNPVYWTLRKTSYFQKHRHETMEERKAAEQRGAEDAGKRRNFSLVYPKRVPTVRNYRTGTIQNTAHSTSLKRNRKSQGTYSTTNENGSFGLSSLYLYILLPLRLYTSTSTSVEFPLYLVQFSPCPDIIALFPFPHQCQQCKMLHIFLTCSQSRSGGNPTPRKHE